MHRTCGLKLRSTRRSCWRYLLGNILMAATFCLLDYLSKRWMLANYLWGHSYPITPFCNIEFAVNSGVAFSWFAQGGAATAQLSLLVAGVVTICLVVGWLKGSSLYISSKSYRLASAILLGGIWGNAIDRWYYGAVFDFIELHWANRWYFPVFNLADVWITIGAIVMFVISSTRRS